MANTFNLGNGNWAQKTEKLLAYNAENDNYKPLPFDFDRGSTATRVNSDGLIETVGVDEPRIDFLNNSKGHLLLEPQRRNEYPNSNDRTSGGSRTSKTGGTTKFVDGLTDVRAERSVNTGSPYFWNSASITSGNKYAFSVFVRLPDTNIEGINSVRILGLTTIESFTAKFNLINGTIISSDADSASIEAFANGWYRLKVTADGVSNATNINFAVYPSNDLGETNFTITTTGRDLLFVNGFQLEEGSYATSYIPTSGQSGGVTRSVEQGIDGGAGTPIFSNTTAVWFLDIERVGVDADSSGSAIALRNSSFSQQIRLHFDSPSEQIRLRDALSGFATISTITGMGSNVRKKIALRINGSALSTFSQGSKIGSDYTAPSTFDIAEIDFGTLGFKIHDMRFYNEALTNAELIALTS